MSKSADAIAVRQAVYTQMSAKFPAASIAWIKTVRWDPAEKVPLGRFDTSDSDSWAASKDPARVDHEVSQWRIGAAKPIVAVQVGDGPLVIVDGHHRYLARKKMDKGRATTWVGHVPNSTGPWMDTHLSQKGGDSA